MRDVAERHISCTLGPDDGETRLREWQELLTDNVECVRRICPTRVELVLRDDPEVILGAVDLGRREQSCCAFLHVALDLRGHEVLLVLTAPDEADVVLDALVGGSDDEPRPDRAATGVTPL